MGGGGRTGLLLVMLVSGCHLIYPFNPDQPPPLDAKVLDAKVLDAGKAEDAQVACTAANNGACHPSQNGQVCSKGVWVKIPCSDTVAGCGEPHGSSSSGYCDPRWSGCVRATATILSCDAHCASLGQKCCDAAKISAGLCSQDQHCITSRGYYKVKWGGESWFNEQSCQLPLRSGAGQQACDAVGTPWNATSKVTYRCCCFPK